MISFFLYMTAPDFCGTDNIVLERLSSAGDGYIQLPHPILLAGNKKHDKAISFPCTINVLSLRSPSLCSTLGFY